MWFPFKVCPVWKRFYWVREQNAQTSSLCFSPKEESRCAAAVELQGTLELTGSLGVCQSTPQLRHMMPVTVAVLSTRAYQLILTGGHGVPSSLESVFYDWPDALKTWTPERRALPWPMPEPCLIWSLGSWTESFQPFSSVKEIMTRFNLNTFHHQDVSPSRSVCLALNQMVDGSLSKTWKIK